MGSSDIHRARVLADSTICHICEEHPALAGRDEFGGHTCVECRQQLVKMRKRHAQTGGYSERYTK